VFSKHNQLSRCSLKVYSNIYTSAQLISEITKWYETWENNSNKFLSDKLFIFDVLPEVNFMGSSGKVSEHEKEMLKLQELRMAGAHIKFTSKIFHTNKSFNNIFGPECKQIKDTFLFFKGNEYWYSRLGVPYQMTCLFSGKPGTGKTSSIKAIANELGRHIINVNFKYIKTTKQFYNLFNDVYIYVPKNDTSSSTDPIKIPLDKRLYIFEEIDILGDVVLDRESSTNTTPPIEGKLSLSDILVILDGTNEFHNRVIIMTTNYPEKLDRALRRSGRINLLIDFQFPTQLELEQYVNFFYDIDTFHFPETMSEYLLQNFTYADMTTILFTIKLEDLSTSLIDKIKSFRNFKSKLDFAYTDKSRNTSSSTPKADKNEIKDNIPDTGQHSSMFDNNQGLSFGKF